MRTREIDMPKKGRVVDVSEWLESEGILPLLRKRGLQSYEEDLLKAVDACNNKFKRFWPSLEMKDYQGKDITAAYFNSLKIENENYTKEAVGILNNYLSNIANTTSTDSSFIRSASDAQYLSTDLLSVSSMADDVVPYFLEYLWEAAKNGRPYESGFVGGTSNALSKIPENRQKLVLDWTRSGRDEKHAITKSDVDDLKCASKIPDVEWNEYVGCLQTVKEFIEGKDSKYKEAFGNVIEKIFNVPESFRKECFDDIREYESKIADSDDRVAKLMESYALVSKVYGIEKLKEARHILKLALDINVDPVQQARKMIYHEKMIPETEKFLDSVKDKN